MRKTSQDSWHSKNKVTFTSNKTHSKYKFHFHDSDILDSRELKIGYITLECDTCSTLRHNVEPCVPRLNSRSRRALCVPHYNGMWILLRDFIWFPKIRSLFERYKNETIKLKWLRKWGVCRRLKLKKFSVLQASIPPIQFWFMKFFISPLFKILPSDKYSYFEHFTRNWFKIRLMLQGLIQGEFQYSNHCSKQKLC